MFSKIWDMNYDTTQCTVHLCISKHVTAMVHYAEQTLSSLSFWNMLYSMMGELKNAYSGFRQRWVVNFNMLQPFYPQEKSPQYPWKRRMCGPQRQTRTFWRTENLFPLTGLEPGLSSLQPSCYSNYDMTSALITITNCSNNLPFFFSIHVRNPCTCTY